MERVVRYACERQRALNEKRQLNNDLRRKNAELDRARQLAEAASRAKGQFLANMSHEIRTPLTAILGFVEAASDTDGVRSDAFASEALSIIRRNGQVLLELLGDVLDTAKIDAGCLVIENAPVNLAFVVSNVVELVRPLAVEKGVTISLDTGRCDTSWMMSDALRVQQIVLNLVGNAIKFTSDGCVSVTADLEDLGAGRVRGSVRVTDTGIGMSAEQIERIREFRPFAQADSSTTREFGGTGLGLSISSSLAKLLGGELSVESEPGRGSEFTVEFDAARCDPAPMVECAGAEAPRDLSGKRILVVDDSIDNRKLLGHHLVRAGADVEFAVNGRDAVDRAMGTDAALDLIFMDLQMPDQDGITATAGLRDAGFTAPIIALSASTLERDRANAFRAGCDRYMTKPFMRADVVEAAVAALPGDPGQRAA